MRNERDQLRKELAKTNKTVEHQFQSIKQMMETMNFQPTHHSIDQANEDDQANENEVDDDEVVAEVMMMRLMMTRLMTS